jgi:hypothetical protein
MSDVLLGPGEQIVDTQDLIAILEQAIAQMRAEEARPTSHEHALA